MEVTQREYALRLGRIVNRILENPECWDQNNWHCGTAHCIMGHAQIDAGKEPDSDTAFDDGMEWLGLSIEDANWLSTSDRKLPEIYAFAASALAGIAYFGPDGYDPNGYDRQGYNRQGYNRDGYDKDGYNRDGYDRDGRGLPMLDLA